MTSAGALPPPQDLSSEHVIEELSRYGMQRVRDTSVPQILVLSVMGGGFIVASGTTGTGNDRNTAVVAGQLSSATAGPGSDNRVVVLGTNKSQSKPAARASVRAARQR